MTLGYYYHSIEEKTEAQGVTQLGSGEVLMSESNAWALRTLLQLSLFWLASVQIDPSLWKSSTETVLMHLYEPWPSDEIWEVNLGLCGWKILLLGGNVYCDKDTI